jgi:Na+-transporting methylmalonyl-CoA/oxaloacetate decarboxylase gamma subunit
LNKRTFDLQNIIDAQGVELALAGMLIVFVVLTGISLFIAVLPRILPLLNRILPEAEHHTKLKARTSTRAATSDGAIAAAIAFAKHHARENRK